MKRKYAAIRRSKLLDINVKRHIESWDYCWELGYVWKTDKRIVSVRMIAPCSEDNPSRFQQIEEDAIATLLQYIKRRRIALRSTWAVPIEVRSAVLEQVYV